MKLDDLTGLFSQAVEKATSIAEQQVLERLNFYFEDPDPDDDDDTLRPRFRTIQIGGEKIKYPLLAMGDLTPVRTKRFKFKLSTDLNLSGHESKDGKSTIEVSLKSGLFKNTANIEIEGEFEAGETSEAFAQMQDKFNDMIAKRLANLISDTEI